MTNSLLILPGDGIGPDVMAEVRRVSPLFARFIRAKEGSAFLGRMESEQTADDRRQRRMELAGDS